MEGVVASGQADALPVQQYDIRRPESEESGFEEWYWSPVDSPVLGRGGEMVCIGVEVNILSDVR